MVRPSRRGRMRALLTSEESTATVDGDNRDWDEGGIFDPVTGALDQWKQPVRVASTASVTISTALNAGDTIDGVTLADGDRVLLKDQATGSQNGIYVAGTTPARAADFDDDAEVLGALVYVIAGTTNTATAWKVTNTAAVTVGSTSIVWAAFGTGGSASFATPAIALGSSAAAGAASTVIRSDATIAAFDATVPVTQAYSDTAATGSAAFAARRDHRHGMPASGGGGGSNYQTTIAALSGLLYYWKCNEASGTTLAESVSAADTLTLAGGAQTGLGPIMSPAAHTAGVVTSGYFRGSTILDPSATTWTIGVLIDLQAQTGGDTSIFGNWGSNTGTMLYQTSSYDIRFYVGAGNIVGTQLHPGARQFIVGVFNAGTATLYQNGLQTATGSLTRVAPTFKWAINDYQAGSGQHMVGRVSDCFVTNTALSQSTVNSIIVAMGGI